MKPNKILSLILTIFIFHLSAQKNTVNSYEEKWVALKPSKNNKAFFPLYNKKNPELDLLRVISDLTLKAESITIYTEESFMSDEKFCSKPEMKEIEVDTNELKKSNDYLEIHFPNIIPLANIYGLDSTAFIDGAELIVFPRSAKLQIRLSEITEIRIHEARFYDSITKSYDLRADGICFYIESELNGEREIFWIRLNDLYLYLLNPIRYPWYNAIVNKKYEGNTYKYRLVGNKEIKEIKK